MRIGTVAALLLGFVCAARSQVVINEILIDQLPGDSSDRGHQWVEIHNKGTEPVDLGGWTIANREGRHGSGAWRLPAITIPAAGYLVIHFTTGTDSTEFGAEGAHVYSQSSSNFWNPLQDDAALYSPAGMVDYIAWSRFGTPYVPGDAHRAAAEAGIWTADASIDLNAIVPRNFQAALLLSPGQTLGRDADSSDENGLEDFAPRGGVDGFGPTPGARNFRPATEAFAFTAEPQAAAKSGVRKADSRKWTILVYCVEDDVRSTWQFLTDARAGLIEAGMSSDVNIVGMLRTSDSAVSRGRIVPVDQNQVTLTSPDGAGAAIPDVNLGVGATLAEFVEWAGTHYPGSHRALVIFGHGHGWKRSGVDVVPGLGRDALTPGEIRESLGRYSFDYAAFFHRYSASAEVAREVQSITGAYMGFARQPHGYTVKCIAKNTGSADSGAAALFNMTVPADSLLCQGSVQPPEYRYFRMHLTAFTPVIRAADDVARKLLPMLPLFLRRNDPLDNAQMRIREAHVAASIGGPGDNPRPFDGVYDHIELIRFARVLLESGLPDCGQRAALNALIGAIGALAIVDIDRPFLFAYFPARRDFVYELSTEEDGQNITNDGMYNRPGPLTRREGSPRLNPVVYGPNYDELPLAIEPVPTVVDLTAPRDWPVPAADWLLFTRETAWARFVHFYYHPAANVVIEGARPVDRGPCENPYDHRTAVIGERVALSGNGSSDPDRAERTPVPLHHFWDLNAAQGCPQRCVQPFEVAPGADPAEANDNMDAENHLTNTKFDDVDARGATSEFVCQVPGRFYVFLHVWDDNHRFFYGDTLPSARHVHIQTGTHFGVIDCVPPFGGLAAAALPPFLETGNRAAADYAVIARQQTGTATAATALAAAIEVQPGAFSNVRGFLPNYPIDVTGVAGVTQLTANGAAIPDTRTGSVFTDSQGVLRIEFTAGAVGTGILRFQPFGVPTPFELRFPIVARLAPPPDDLTVTVPVNAVSTGQDTSVPVIVRRAGQPLQDAVVTAFSATSTLDFIFGTLFRSNTATQIRTNSAGQATLQFRPRANGPVDIEIFAGTQVRRIQLQSSGGAAQAPTVIEVVDPPEVVKVNEELVLRVRVLAVRQPVEGAQVSMTGAELPAAVTAQTGPDGIATFRLTPRDLAPLELTFNVVGTSLRVAGSIGVSP